MQNIFSACKGPAVILASVLLTACAGYSGSNLKPGVSTLPEVIASMGEPALRWRDADGREQLAYPRGPEATETFMAYIAADGRLERIEPVLNMKRFALIQAGLDQAAVLRVIGPPQPQWTQYFERRDELVWEWRFCDDWSQAAFFDVLFDGTTGLVRTTYQRPDYRWPDGRVPSCGRTPR
jgi:hypothetical protein